MAPPTTTEYEDVVRFLVDEVAVAVCQAAGEGAGAMLVSYRAWDRDRPVGCKSYDELGTVMHWLYAASQRHRRGDADAHPLSGEAAKVCRWVRAAVVAWSNDDEVALREWAHRACESAAAMSDDPWWSTTVRLVGSGVDVAGAKAAARTAVD